MRFGDVRGGPSGVHLVPPGKGEMVDDDPSGRYEKLYTMLLNAIPSSVLLIDRDMRIISANRNFLDRMQRTVGSTIACRLEEVFPPVILDHMDITRRIYEVFEKNRATRGERMTYRAPGVPMRVYYYSVLPFVWEGAVESAMLLMEDVTEQVRLSEDVRRVERHLASVVESASDMMLSTDTEGRIITWNPAAGAISGFTLDEVKGRFFHEYCAPECREDVKGVFARMHAPTSSKMAEWGLVTKQGTTVPVYWVCSPMKDDLNRTVAIVAVGRDLTERRKFEMQLLQSQKLGALGVMAGGIAHEIRNPLAICSSAAQFLMEDDITPEFRNECAEKIHVGILRASGIIENLLRFARPAAVADMARTDLVPLLHETLDLVMNQARIQKIDVVSSLPERSVVVTGNAGLLQQVFMNLFVNAIRAMPDGGSLGVCLEVAGGETVIRVSDTGCGISGRDITSVFDPFYTTSPVGKGTGLGLSICYSIVKRHFGSIEVESTDGKGTVFTIRLPLG